MKDSGVTWEQLIDNVVRLYDTMNMDRPAFLKAVWEIANQVRTIERNVDAQLAEDMGSYEIAQAIRQGQNAI